MGPEFWERRDRQIRADRRALFSFILSAFPPLCVVAGVGLFLTGIRSPATTDRGTMIAVGLIGLVVGIGLTALVWYVRMLRRRLKPSEVDRQAL
ncbi:MAG TPA: hypothetical protein VN018_02395 [Brevundimonas sp.]|nr:hypothetical protein [Brevundimonas sp.]